MKFKKLAIISDCIHVFDEDGNAATENHIFRRQIEALTAHFDQTLICCPFEVFTKHKVLTKYNDNSIQFLPLPNAGGNTLKDKIQLVKLLPAWFKAFKKAYRFADIVYQRFPNNINIPGFLYFYVRRSKVFATYTGTWQNYTGEPVTYRFQKWVLAHLFRGPVGVYVLQENNNGRIFKTISPSYTEGEWHEETEQVRQRIERLNKTPASTPVFITVGALITNKNQQFILDAFLQLSRQGFNFKLYVVGDGNLKESYQKFVADNALEEQVIIAGKKTNTQLRELYREADFLIQAPFVEGFGKVPVEGFFHGVIPLLSNVALAKEMTGHNNERGFIFSPHNVSELTSLIVHVTNNKVNMRSLIENARTYVYNQTLESWAKSYCDKIESYFE